MTQPVMVSPDQWEALLDRVTTLERQVGELQGAVPAAPTEEPRKGKRGTRIDPKWYPTQHTIQVIREEYPFVDRDDLLREHKVFVDYWRAMPGARGVKLDWGATWRNWMRKTFAESRFDSRRHQTTSVVDQKIARLQSMKE